MTWPWTVRARVDTYLYSITHVDLQDLLARSAELRATLTGTSDARYVET